MKLFVTAEESNTWVGEGVEGVEDRMEEEKKRGCVGGWVWGVLLSVHWVKIC